ncbi:FAD-dependent oxidoreductase [Ensifer adhaerens]|uniref:FAD-dependent oxidoreductase n=1 Tax=Ensifer adhaerens TaxID=106592 RepID=UPI003AF39817|nr:FAD-dependent oxidoreductase [Ensifer adhaerens]UAY02261.1 FAD-dependent oxidoreductase [Ensifer adhaerens]UAY09643.1 FAD-dependent oxidoreductase [Ensifer adhaerens]
MSEGATDNEVVVIGGGPTSYPAAHRAAAHGLKVAIVEQGGTSGGVCLNVGCIPPKALLHVAAVFEEAAALADHGFIVAPPRSRQSLQAYL